ncbi:hypothetical protein Scep_002971 [Stephania cephalantha]|uniref:Leucine-rich repeat-containing N-terminal plant-type domain-containing protein n=1 Tax=Stephania cephalantha TaxID=152367 RepID=A0AAP0LC05_9MAGN
MVRKIEETTQSVIGQEEVKSLEIVIGIEDEHEEGLMVERYLNDQLGLFFVDDVGGELDAPFLMASTDCCTSWDGVTCDDFGFVIGLDVSQSGLFVNRAAIHHNISSTSPCRPDQSLALLQFKSSFSIEYDVSKLWSWKANTDCCTSWEGVSCDHFGYVIGLDASKSGLVGNIDSNNSLFNLYHLQNVNLANNDFNFSSIPAGFA